MFFFWFLFSIFSCFCFLFGLGVGVQCLRVTVVALAMLALRTIAAAIVWPEGAILRLSVMPEQGHAFVQRRELDADLCDDWLNERRNRIGQVLYDAQ